MKVINHFGKWFSFKLDQLAKIFISKQDLMDIALEEQEKRINKMITSLKELRTHKKNLVQTKEKNTQNIKTAEKRIEKYIKQGKDDLAKLQIKYKLEQYNQNEFLEKSIELMGKRQKVMKETLEKLKGVLEISKDKVEFYKRTYDAANSTLGAIDVDNTKRIELRQIMGDIESEINTMDNKIEVIHEMEEEGITKKDETDSIDDSVVEDEFQKLKNELKPSNSRSSRTR